MEVLPFFAYEIPISFFDFYKFKVGSDGRRLMDFKGKFELQEYDQRFVTCCCCNDYPDPAWGKGMN